MSFIRILPIHWYCFNERVTSNYAVYRGDHQATTLLFTCLTLKLCSPFLHSLSRWKACTFITYCSQTTRFTVEDILPVWTLEQDGLKYAMTYWLNACVGQLLIPTPFLRVDICFDTDIEVNWSTTDSGIYLHAPLTKQELISIIRCMRSDRRVESKSKFNSVSKPRRLRQIGVVVEI